MIFMIFFPICQFRANNENNENPILGEFWDIFDSHRNPRIQPKYGFRDFLLEWHIEAKKSKMQISRNSPYLYIEK